MYDQYLLYVNPDVVFMVADAHAGRQYFSLYSSV